MSASAGARRDKRYSLEIAATGHAYPSLVIDGRGFAARALFELSSSVEDLERETGVLSRRWCGPGETTWTLARTAARAAIDRAPDLASEIDVVLVASGTTMPVLHPADPENPGVADIAPMLLRDLGIENGLGLDLKACYCTGFLRCLEVADALLATGDRRAALVVATEQGSRLATAATNRSSFCFIMADAAGAAIVKRRDGEPKPAQPGLIDYVNEVDAAKLDWVGVGADGESMVMKGARAGEATLELLIRAGKTLLDRNGLGPSEIDWLLPIQTHRALVDRARHVLEVPREKTLWFGDRVGFSGSASIPACLSEQLEAGKIRSGDLILAIAVGAGLSWGAALIRA